MAIRVGVNTLQFCSVSNSLSHTTLSIKWEVYFSKNCVARLYCVVVMILHAYVDVLCLYIWRVLASSQGISSWTPLKPQHSNPNTLANQLWCIDFLTPPTPLIIPHRLPAFLWMSYTTQNWCSIHAKWSKSSLKHSIRFCGIFSKFKTEFYCLSFF